MGVYVLVWGRMYLLCVGIQVVVYSVWKKICVGFFLCVAGCVRKILGIGPGLSSMSPHFRRSNLLMK